MPESLKPSLPVLNKPQPTKTKTSPTSSAQHSKNTFSLVATTLLLFSLVYGIGVFHGANAHHQASPVVPVEETGHRGATGPGSGANGLLTGP